MSKNKTNIKTPVYYLLQLGQRASLALVIFNALLYWMAYVSVTVNNAVAGELDEAYEISPTLSRTINGIYNDLSGMVLLWSAVALVLTALLFNAKKSRGGHRAFVANTLLITGLSVLSVEFSKQIFDFLVR